MTFSPTIRSKVSSIAIKFLDRTGDRVCDTQAHGLATPTRCYMAGYLSLPSKHKTSQTSSTQVRRKPGNYPNGPRLRLQSICPVDSLKSGTEQMFFPKPLWRDSIFCSDVRDTVKSLLACTQLVEMIKWKYPTHEFGGSCSMSRVMNCISG